MSLRRTGIARRTELRRTELVRTSKRAPRRPAGHRKPKPTGPTAGVKLLVAERAGYACEICGLRLHDGDAWVGDHSIHHRRPRGMGGTSRADTNTAPNLLLLCGSGTTGCHGYLEGQRALARHAGWLVEQHHDPATVPAVIHGRGPTTLTAAGNYEEPPSA